MTKEITDKKEKEEILKQTVIQDEKVSSPEQTLAEKLKERNALRRKKKIRIFGTIGFLIFFAYALYYLFKPFTGTIPYGICKTFLELNVPFPPTLLLSEVTTTRKGAVKIWFTHIDAFGSYRLDSFVCSFAADEKTGMPYLSEVKMGKLNIDPVSVKKFNVAIPYLITNPPDLTLPVPLPDSLENIHFDFNRFRKPIL